MIINVLLYCCLLLIPTALGIENSKNNWQDNPKESTCLTGYMTDIQPWVNEFGDFTPHVDRKTAIDLSSKQGVLRRLGQELSIFKSSRLRQVTHLSMAKCKLTRVPSVFKLEDNLGRKLSDTLEFMTLYGNNFGFLDSENQMFEYFLNATDANELPVPASHQRRKLAIWSSGFRMQLFRKLRELDLRACSIQVLGDYTFERMPELRSLYLGENYIFHIDSRTFTGLQNLRHLDLSRNYAYDESGVLGEINFESVNVFDNLTLQSVDFSFTRLGKRNNRLLERFGRQLKRLSLCNSGLGRLRDDTFVGTSLKYLDVSGNTEILNSPKALKGVENHLEVLYADNVSMKNMECFMKFSRLEILKLSYNEISIVPQNVAKTLTNLQILDLDNNRMTSWFNNTFILMPNLKLLSLKNNNINVISREMYYDLEKLSYLGLSGNFLVCNCHARDVFEVASNNELLFRDTNIGAIANDFQDFISFHTGFMDFNNIILRRRNITTFCERRTGCNVEFNYDVIGNYLLLDYYDYSNQYQCLLVTEGKTTGLYSLASCATGKRELDLEQEEIIGSWNKYLLILIPGMILPLLLCIYIFRKTFRYFLITIKNSATLSLISKNDSPDDDASYTYDVFVSYCHDDRVWVLDKLLTHVEKGCNISVCLHERDFQIGLSILENIVSCMDRSRMIMLILSKKFLLSQWCQFEMHLAQHRLLETRREDLILVLLEEIPRRFRPNTLHYLMLTKTYIVWPQKESERSLFWKRMKKSIVTHKLKQKENSSLV